MTIGLMACILIVVVIGSYLIVVKYWSSESEKHSHYASALQNIVIVISIICTGAWTIQTFGVLQQKEKASADLKELHKRINNTESTNISIKTQVVNYDSVNDNKTGLIVEVTIKNQGKSKISFDLKDSPLKIYKVVAEGSKIGSTEVLTPKVYSELAQVTTSEASKPKGENIPLDRWISLSSSERTLSYFVTLEKSSMYYIVFSTKALEMDTLKKECEEQSCNWFVSKYVYIDGKK
jgi:hypothetical protein